MKKAWAVGLEDIGDNNVDITELENPAEGVEAKLIEVQGQDAEIEAVAADGEELARDTDALEATADVVADAAEDGGMDETAARVVDVAVEHFCERWGIRRTRIGVESFSANKVQATKVALESIGDAIKDAWNTFVSWLTEILNKLKDWWLKYFNAGKAMKDRANKLEDRLDSVGTKEKDKIKGGWLKDLYLDGAAKVDEIISAAGALDAEVRGAISAIAGELTEAGKFVKSNVNNKVVEFGKKTQKKFDSLIPSGSTDVSVSAVAGNGFLIQYTKNDVRETRFQVFPVGEGATKEIATPDVAKMKQACSAVAKIGDVLETRLKDFRTVNEEMNKLKEAAKKAASDLKDAKSEERDTKKAGLREARAAVNTALATQKCVTHALKSSGTGLLGFVQAGIGAYKKAG